MLAARPFILESSLLALCLVGCDRFPMEPIEAARAGGGGPPVNAPSTVTAVAESQTRIDVSWQDNSDNETGFEVHRSTTGSSGAFALLASTGAGVTSYRDAGLMTATTYCYKARAFRRVNKTSYSAFSNTACETTFPPPPPTTGDLRVTTATTGSPLDPDGYYVIVDAAAFAQRVAPNGTLTITGIQPGDHAIRLHDVDVNCTVDGANPETANVVAGTTTDVSFAVTCAPLGQLAFQTVWAADGSLIYDAFEIVLTGPDSLVNLTMNPAEDAEPAWSPDGSRIAFTSTRDLGGIYVMNADGSSPLRLADGVSPAWSADGETIAFVLNDGIYVVNTNGAGPVRLADGVDPAWSPDGGRIGFANAGAIFVMNADGTGVIQLTTSRYDVQPAWSPDGANIVFAGSTGCAFDIFVMRADGSGVTKLTTSICDPDAGGGAMTPAWSPDGRKIAFVQYEAVTVMNADGSNPVYLWPGFNPAWRP